MTGPCGRRTAMLLLAGAMAPEFAQAQDAPGIPQTAPLVPTPVLPTPVLPAPVLPAPVLPAPVLPVPVLPAPVLPVPGAPAPPAAAARPAAAPPAIDRTKAYYVFFDQAIDVNSARALRRQLASLVEAGVADITLVINSPGGLVEPTLLTYGFIRALPVRLSTHAQVFVQSAATLLFLAGNSRSADRDARFLFHPAQSLVAGLMGVQQMDERLMGFQTINSVEAEILHDRTSLTDAEIERFNRETVIYTAEQAKAAAVVETVADLQIPGSSTARMLFLD